MDTMPELIIALVVVCGVFVAIAAALKRNHRWVYYAFVTVITLALLYEYRFGLLYFVRHVLP